MLVSYLKKENQMQFLNTYSSFDSAIHGFNRECKKIAEKEGIKPIDVAGEQAFLSSINFVCSYCNKRTKKCKSIKEMEKWLTNYKDNLKDVKIKAESEEIGDMNLTVLCTTEPIFFGQGRTSSQFLYDLFKKKTKNWLVELTE